MKFVDHSRGFEPAKKGDHLRWGIRLFCNACGAEVDKEYSVTCLCRKLARSIVDDFDDDAMACRFHIRPWANQSLEVLVWKTDPLSKKRYTSLVPRGEAHPHERVKL